MFYSLFLLALASEPSTPDLVLEVRGLTTSSGQVLCMLYSNPELWLTDAGVLLTARAKPSGTQATCVFKGVRPGAYAISFIHDENGNGDMDNNFFGFPKEPWGFSLDASVRLGPPSFKSAKFLHPDPMLIAHLR